MPGPTFSQNLLSVFLLNKAGYVIVHQKGKDRILSPEGLKLDDFVLPPSNLVYPYECAIQYPNTGMVIPMLCMNRGYSIHLSVKNDEENAQVLVTLYKRYKILYRESKKLKTITE